MNFTDEALEHWNKLSTEEQREWTENLTCQSCGAEIDANNINGSIYEEQLALFHECASCDNKEVRLVEINLQHQKAIDDDFEQWVKAKKAAKAKSP
jgi:hypothetical protein